ncbi:MAG TPA: heavy metal translocating P-type ATPase [Verrucomicrobiales bacterium]|nr:heavy metal translocating P-type ATPase [Verrucomicrobiales bacterium]
MTKKDISQSEPDRSERMKIAIAVLSITSIVVYLVLRYLFRLDGATANLPLWISYGFGGIPLVWGLLKNFVRREFGSDLLAGISIVTALILGEYLAGVLVVLMLSGGEALEVYAIRSASSVLKALSKRMPSVAHRKSGASFEDVALDEVGVGDELEILPHEICPVDGTVIAGHGVMDESFLTGEPYLISKSPGSMVISGALNGESSLTIRAEKLAIDSRYAKIMEVMRDSEEKRPKIRRLADRLGAFYTPVAIVIAVTAWIVAGDPLRFLAVLVVATPCPLLIGIPVAIIGSISLAAKRAIIVRDPTILETIDRCRSVIFDKTGTLTYGRPELTGEFPAPGYDADEMLQLIASAEIYSKHPLASAIVSAAQVRGLEVLEVDEISEKPGQGMTAKIQGREIRITSRKQLAKELPDEVHLLPDLAGGLECVVLLDGRYAATFHFRDEPKPDGRDFIKHLGGKHGITHAMILSGDRQSEAEYLGARVGITDARGGRSPEEKLAIVREETALRKTIYVGDGINDAPALMAATVGIAFGQSSDITAKAAGAVIMDSSLRKVDELIHIGRRMRRIALQSAVGGMALSIIGMFFAAAGWLPPVAGAVTQEVIDVLAVLNALRVALPPKRLTDY